MSDSDDGYLYDLVADYFLTESFAVKSFSLELHKLMDLSKPPIETK